MKQIELNGNYKLKYFEPQSFRIEQVQDPHFFPVDWMDTRVPEDVRSVLRRYGYLDGYYFGKDLDKERWIDEKDWVYYHRFFADSQWKGQRAELVFEGIDTLARVWLNGRELGTCINMFREYCFDVTDLLCYDRENALVVQVLSPISATKDVSREGIYPQEDTTRMLLRKSQMNWGWDFCGHCLTAGIWKPVKLKVYKEARLEDVRLTTVSVNHESGQMHFSCNVKHLPEDQNSYTVQVTITGEGAPVCSFILPEKKAEDYDFILENPKLWWPKPYGDPYLYDVKVRLLKEEKTADETNFRFGIRTVELIQQRENSGRSFRFRINGRDLFIRGANWVPLNCVYTDITQEQYDSSMERILDSNLSMLRIWGGGIYESEYFLDLCDQNGILIFQDMMLACGIFPQDQAFLREVKEEVAEIVRKNYNRTCIVIWSADNELDEAYRWYDMLEQFPTNLVNRLAVRKGVEENDSVRPFLVSSPCSPFPEEAGGDDPNSDLQGDMHLYLTRFQKDSEYYYKKILELQPRFMSEYGFSSLPVESSYYRFNFRKEGLDLSRNPWLGQLDWLAEQGKSGDTAKTIYYSQFTHANALKYWIEYLRCLKWHCGGSLYWKFNDPVAPNREDMLFPSLMSSVDFFGQPKLAYYYARRAYEDRILAFREDLQGNVAVYSCSECLEPVTGTLEVQIREYGGTVVWEKRMECTIPEDAAAELLVIPETELRNVNYRRCYITADFSGEGLELHNIFHLTEIGYWNTVEMEKAKIKASIAQLSEDIFEIRVSADRFAQDVTIEFSDEIVYYTDNGICLQQNETRVIQARLKNSGNADLWVRITAANADPLCCYFKQGSLNHEIQIM